MRSDAVEHLDRNQAHIKGGCSREHRAKVFWCVNMSMATAVIVVMRSVMSVFH